MLHRAVVQQRTQSPDRRLCHQRPEVLDIGCGVHGLDTVHGLGGGRVDREDVGMGERATDEGRMGGARQLHIVGVSTATLDKSRVFAAPYDTAKHTR